MSVTPPNNLLNALPDGPGSAAMPIHTTGGGGGGGTVTQGPGTLTPADPWSVEVTEDGTDTKVKIGDAANKAVRANVVTPVLGFDAANAATGPLPLNDGGTSVLVEISNSVVNTPSFFSRSDIFAAPGNGVTVNVSVPYKFFGIQIVAAGTVTVFTVVLEVSLDGGTSFGTLITVTQADLLGTVKFNPATAVTAPVLSFRSRCTALTLGTAPSIGAYIIGSG